MRFRPLAAVQGSDRDATGSKNKLNEDRSLAPVLSAKEDQLSANRIADDISENKIDE